MNFKPILIFSCISIVFNSCLLSFEEDPLTRIQDATGKNLKTNVIYSYNGTEFFPLKDTLYLEELVKIKFYHNTILKSEVYIDGTLIWSENNPNEFELTKSNRIDGTYDIKIVQFVKTNTNSLSDKFDAEYVKYEDSFKLVIGKCTYTPNFKVELIDGNVVLKWNKFSRSDFQGYEIKKRLNNSAGEYRIINIVNINKSESIDNNYVGNETEYIFSVKVGDNKITEQKNFKVPYKPFFQIIKVADNSYKITWEKPIFAKNVKEYSISISYPYHQEYVNKTFTVSGEVYSMEYNQEIELGRGVKFYLEVIPKLSDYKEHEIAYYNEVSAVGTRLPSYSKIIYDYRRDLYYLLHYAYYNTNPNRIYVLDNNLNKIKYIEIENEFGIDKISLNNNYLYLYSYGIISRLDLNTYEIEDVYTSGTSILTFYTTDNNLTLFSSWCKTGFCIDVIDLNKKEKIISVPMQFKLYSFDNNYSISNDGKYLVVDENVYVFSNETYIMDHKLPFDNILLLKFIDNTYDVIIYASGYIYVYDILNKAIKQKYTYNLFGVELPEFNFATMELVLNENFPETYTSKLNLLNVNTGEERKIDCGGHFRGNHVFINIYEHIISWSYGNKIN